MKGTPLLLLKKTAIPAYLAVLLAAGGCFPSYVGKMMPKYKATGYKIGGKYFIHKNPRPGDYAVYKIYGRSRFEGTGLTVDYAWEGTRRVSIGNIKDGTIEIHETDRAEKVEVLEKKGFMQATIVKPEFQRFLLLDMEGNILKAKSNGGMSNWPMRDVPLAQPGEEGYINQQSLKKNLVINVPVGSFKTLPYWHQVRQATEVGNVLTDTKADAVTYIMTYVNDDVKFRTVSANAIILIGFATKMSPVEYVSLFVDVYSAPLLANPADSVKDFIRMSPRDFAKSTAIEKSMAWTINFSHDMNTSYYYYLVEQGERGLHTQLGGNDLHGPAGEEA